MIPRCYFRLLGACVKHSRPSVRPKLFCKLSYLSKDWVFLLNWAGLSQHHSASPPYTFLPFTVSPWTCQLEQNYPSDCCHVLAHKLWCSLEPIQGFSFDVSDKSQAIKAECSLYVYLLAGGYHRLTCQDFTAPTSYQLLLWQLFCH